VGGAPQLSTGSLNFIFHEKLRKGRPSNFVRLETPEREDA
jgi:hypothetical protein